jgi:hypothetical protein
MTEEVRPKGEVRLVAMEQRPGCFPEPVGGIKAAWDAGITEEEGHALIENNWCYGQADAAADGSEITPLDRSVDKLRAAFGDSP